MITLEGDDGIKELSAPNSRGLKLVVSWTSLPHLPETGLPAGTKTVSVFVVNDRPSSGSRLTYRDIAFQVELELSCAHDNSNSTWKAMSR